MNTTRALTLFLALVGFIPLALSTPAVRAVDSAIVRVSVTGKTSDPCGGTWANTCGLQYALTNTIAGSELWVAAGTYLPTGITRTATFQLRDDIALYGGFAGSEAQRTQRNFTTNVTILSGDIGTPGDASDNSYHVVIGSGVTNTAVLDGFTVTGGNANYRDDPGSQGGGMYNGGGSPTLANITFTGNIANRDGGGMFNGGNSNPMLTNVIFSGNTAGEGGGMSNRVHSSPTITNATFTGNTVTGTTGSGGGMSNEYYANPSLTNVTFSSNSADREGGGMSNDWNSSPTLTNVSFSGNSGGIGGGMLNAFSNPTLTNVTFTSNSGSQAGGMVNYNSSPTLANVTFSGNSGWGMFNSSSPTLSNVTFSGNPAAQFGGGMNNGASSNPTLINVTFSGNSSRFGGG